MTSVYVVGGDFSVIEMFTERGFTIYVPDCTSLDPDLVCFTGGADVQPKLYGEENFASFPDPARDEREQAVFKTYLQVPKVGICRGGQLLNVLNGGKMIQDIPGHGMNYHDVFDKNLHQVIEVQGDHHQGILPNHDTVQTIAQARDGIWEVLYYPMTESLCFQPHPEWGHKGTEDYFFGLLLKTLGIEGD
jgi:gamma-glutamyl-gamma-aminobutyrate hydrolase PuuD